MNAKQILLAYIESSGVDSSLSGPIAEYLEINEYDGLYNPIEPCGCNRDELMPCGEQCDDCVPAYLWRDGLYRDHREEGLE